MTSRKKLFAGILLLLLVNVYAEMNNIALYVADYSKDSPVIDGQLNDSCWKHAKICTDCYVYNQIIPEPGELKNGLQIIWNEQGIFLGIVNYGANIANVCGKYTTRDAPELWKDDCAEIYFDPADAVGFTKFVVNVLGTLGDMRQIDSAVILNEWNASGVQVAVQKNVDSWNIEMFIPWSDLGQTATVGNLWRFCHVRYDWSSGKFIGTTSSPGGSYARPGNFGYLYFAGSSKPDRSVIAATLAKKVTPPWSLPVDDGFLVCEKDQPVFEKLSSLIGKEQEKLKIKLEELTKNIKIVQNSELDKKIKAIKARVTSAATAPDTIKGLKSLQILNADLTQLNSQVELEQLLN